MLGGFFDSQFFEPFELFGILLVVLELRCENYETVVVEPSQEIFNGAREERCLDRI